MNLIAIVSAKADTDLDPDIIEALGPMPETELHEEIRRSFDLNFYDVTFEAA